MTPFDVITTVQTPASSYDLTTLAAVKAELSITDSDSDAWIGGAISQVSGMIASYCRRVFPVEELTDTFYVPARFRRHQRVDNRDILQLTRWPVTAVSSVTETAQDGTATVLVQDTDFVRNDAVGQLIRLNSDTGFPGLWTAAKIAVVYSAGYATIPNDLVRAALRMVTDAWWDRKRDPRLMSESEPGVGDKRYWIPQKDGAFPPEIAEMLDGVYRVPTL